MLGVGEIVTIVLIVVFFVLFMVEQFS